MIRLAAIALLFAKVILFLFLAMLFMPLALIDRFWYSDGIERFAFNMIDEFRDLDLISEEQAKEARKDFR